VDIAEVRQLVEPHQICLIGNVEHQFLEIGTENDLRRSSGYCLEHGGAGKPGYVYSTSNAVNEHSRMDRYLLMQQIRHEKMAQLDYLGPSYPTSTVR
jgi:uroporphyrinogen-III decarboxylase